MLVIRHHDHPCMWPQCRDRRPGVVTTRQHQPSCHDSAQRTRITDRGSRSGTIILRRDHDDHIRPREHFGQTRLTAVHRDQNEVLKQRPITRWRLARKEPCTSPRSLGHAPNHRLSRVIQSHHPRRPGRRDRPVDPKAGLSRSRGPRATVEQNRFHRHTECWRTPGITDTASRLASRNDSSLGSKTAADRTR